MRRLAPKPPGRPLTGHVREVRRDVLGLLTRSAAACGDVVRFRLGPLVVHLVNHPDLIAEVLVKKRDLYDKSTRSSQSLATICGESLLTANGPAWHRRRRLVQPVFHRAAIATCGSIMTDCARSLVDSWRGQPHVDGAAEMMRVTYRIVGRCLFSTDELTAEAETIAHAMETLVSRTYERWRRLFSAPPSWPTPANQRFREALAQVDGVISRLIERSREHPPATPDLLSLLLSARDDETKTGFTDAEVRNEAVTFLLAGHETTATSLAWALALLAKHPGTADAIAAELTDALGEAPVTLESLPRLPLLDRVFREALRLYPPIWAIERRALADDEIGGFFVPRNSSVIVSPWALHRHPGFWSNPDAFDPERFATEAESPAYLPFGLGPRACIGREFALAEGRIILAEIVRAFRLRIDAFPEPEPAITLRMKGGLRLHLEQRL